jgi:hypothetical protein
MKNDIPKKIAEISITGNLHFGGGSNFFSIIKMVVFMIQICCGLYIYFVTNVTFWALHLCLKNYLKSE